MAQTLASGVVIPAPGDRISAAGVQEMRTLGASVDAGLSLAQAQVAQTDAQSRARDADLADQVAGMEGMTYVGAWQSGRTYRINDVVTHGGDSWARLTAGSTGEPGVSATDWGLVARQGAGGGFGDLVETEVVGLYDTVEASMDLDQIAGLDTALVGKRNVAPTVIGQNVNLNDVTTPGEHSQQFTAWATPELNYPGGASPVAGRLFVGANVQRTQVTQIYIPFTTSVVEMWVRNFYNTWGTWRRLVLDNDARLSDARTPKAHTHVAADITDLGAAVYNHGDIPNGTDINTLRTPGLWAAPKTSIVSTLTNWPAQLNGTAGFLEVMWATNGLTMQKVTGYGGNAVTVQRTSLSVTNGTYTPWEQITPPDLSAYATTTYVDGAVAGATGADVTGVHEQNTIRRTMFTQAMGRVGTGGKAAFALRTDHGYKGMAELVLPLCRTRGIVPSTLYNPRNWARPENTGYAAADLNTWVAAGEVEVWNHGATHADVSDLAALEDEIVASIAEIEASVPAAAGKVWGFAPPGVDTATGYGGYGNGASPEKWDSAAGRLILKHHAVNNAYVPGTGYRILDGTIRDGVSHFTMDNATVARLKGYIDTAIANRQGVQFMVHPYVVDTEGKITTAQIAEVLDYVVAKRDSGDLVTLTPYQMMVADSALPEVGSVA